MRTLYRASGTLLAAAAALPLAPPAQAGDGHAVASPQGVPSAQSSYVTPVGVPAPVAYSSSGPPGLLEALRHANAGGGYVAPYSSRAPAGLVEAMPQSAVPARASAQGGGMGAYPVSPGSSYVSPSPYAAGMGGGTGAGGPTSQYAPGGMAPGAMAPGAMTPGAMTPGAPGTTALDAAAMAGGAPAPAAAPPAVAEGAAQGGIGGAAEMPFNMIGDASPIRSFQVAPVPGGPGQVPPIPPPRRSIIVPSVREFKIAENQSPVPQDRVFFNYNFYEDVNKRLNDFFQVPLVGVEINRYIFGFEKTFNNGLGSVGLWLPLNNVHARSRRPGVPTGGDSTALGNLTPFIKHIFAVDPASGSVATGGLAISPRMGPGPFGGAPFLFASNTTTIQPFFGYFLNSEKVFLHGFEAVDVPTGFNQPTMLYSDVGVGYYLYRRPDAAGLIRAVIPTFEVHANIPLNHRGEYSPDPFGTPDVLNLTYGVNFLLFERTSLTLGLVTPVTGPRPFDYEYTLLLNHYFGRRARRLANIPPMIGG